jgi:uncharacterized protein
MPKQYKKLLIYITIFFFSWSTLASPKDPIRVLSIDAGGIRGIIAAIVLKEIEKEVGRPIAKIFDMVAGSSTGGIIALALVAPNHLRQPIKTAKEIVNLYVTKNKKIFQTSWEHWLMNLGGLLGPKYQSSGFAVLLHDQLGNTMLSDALIPTLITGYHIEGESGIEFFSEDAKEFPKDKDCLMREIGLATAAAPVYFESVDISFPWGKLSAVADGGLYKYNPAILAYTNAKKLFPNRKIELYSVGTGQVSAEKLTSVLKERGLLQWFRPIIRHIQIGGTEADNAVLDRLLNENGEENYFRLNVRLENARSSMDDNSEKNLIYLYNKGIEITRSKTFQIAIGRLKNKSQV